MIFGFLGSGFLALPTILLLGLVYVYLKQNFGALIANITVVSFPFFFVMIKGLYKQTAQQFLTDLGQKPAPRGFSDFEWFCTGVFVACMIANTVLILRKVQKRH